MNKLDQCQIEYESIPDDEEYECNRCNELYGYGDINNQGNCEYCQDIINKDRFMPLEGY